MAPDAHQPDITALMPFAQTCGIRLESASAEEVVVLMDWAPERCRHLHHRVQDQFLPGTPLGNGTGGVPAAP